MKMDVLATKTEVRQAVAPVRAGGGSVGLVPTMGYLHEGHLSLVRRARAECDLVIVSIFVNPTQFGPSEDLDRYPRDLDRDLALCHNEGVDVVFHPETGEMYGDGYSTWVIVELLGDYLCGSSRPTHFRGVTTVCSKLFGICTPDRAYFGQKDAQQAFIVRRMVEDLDQGLEIVVCPTVREADGLAMSSRNVYLSPEQRAQAPALQRALKEAEALVAAGERSAAAVKAAVTAKLAEAPLGQTDYVEIVETMSLQPVQRLHGEVLLALAVRFGSTRLIDNTVMKVVSRAVEGHARTGAKAGAADRSAAPAGGSA
jgi:pantoate--beta-alanine ligase